ncbi:MAG: hypothetical protein V4556_12470 [Bacteroidota bacterium]
MEQANNNQQKPQLKRMGLLKKKASEPMMVANLIINTLGLTQTAMEI